MAAYNKKHQMIKIYGGLAMDLISIAISYLLAYILRFGINHRPNLEDSWLQIYFFCILICVLYNLITDQYHHFFHRGYYLEAISVGKYSLFLFVAVSACVYVFRMELIFSRLLLGYFTVLNAMFTYILRIVFKNYMKIYYRKSKSSDKILVVTDSGELEKVMEHIEKDNNWSYEITGIAIVDINRVGEEVQGVPIVAYRDNLIDIARQSPIDVVFIHCPEEKKEELEVWIQAFLAMGVVCHNCIERFGIETRHNSTGKFAEFPVMTYSMTVIDYRRKIVKRLMDVVGGIIGLLFTGIILPFVALAIKADSSGPVFFSQTRIGKNGRRFKIYKFRSMYIDAEERKKDLMQQNEMQGLMFKMDKDPRITRVGDFLRRTSIDELPQFWNVVRGDMSLVGTRPPTVEEFEQYNVYYRRRLSITPGLTGLWQVSGRSDIKNFDEVVKLDLKYIDEWSLRKDIKILLQTIGVVLFRKGSK